MPDQLARERINTLLFYGCIFVLAYFIYLLFRPFLTALAWAAIFAALFHPQYKRLERRLGRATAASIGTTAVTLIIVVPFVLVGIAFVQEAVQTVSSFNASSGSSQGLARLQRGWAWLQRQRAPAAEPADDLARQGQRLFLDRGCAFCHTVRGTTAFFGRTGPDLTHVASRRTLAAATLTNVGGHLAGWIANPQALKPGNHMPAVPLEPAEFHAVLRYLQGLH